MTAASAPSSSSPGVVFGAQASAAASTGLGLGFGAAVPPAPSAFGLGAAPAPSAFGLGAAQAPAPSGFSFGAQGAAPSPASSSVGFGAFGGSKSSGFGGAQPASASSGLGFGTPAAFGTAFGDAKSVSGAVPGGLSSFGSQPASGAEAGPLAVKPGSSVAPSEPTKSTVVDPAVLRAVRTCFAAILWHCALVQVCATLEANLVRTLTL